MEKIKKILQHRIFILFITIIIYAIVANLLSKGKFFSMLSLLTIINSLSSNSIIVIGIAIALILGCFDLSVGSTYALGGIVVAVTLNSGVPILVAVLCGLFVGVLVGTLNGIIVGYIGIDALIGTISTMLIIRSIAYLVIPGMTMVYINNLKFQKIFQFRIFGFSFSAYIAVFLILVFGILLLKNKFFRKSYFIGGNEKAAVLSGIDIKKHKLFIYILTGILAAFAGILLAGRVGSAYSNYGQTTALEVTSAAIIGGVSIKGGKGEIFGSFLGVVFISMIYNSFILMNVNIYWGEFFIGAMLLISIVLDRYSTRRVLE